MLYVYRRCSVRCYTAYCVVTGAKYDYTYVMYTQCVYNIALCTYINERAYTHAHWKSLHPLCSSSGYGPCMTTENVPFQGKQGNCKKAQEAKLKLLKPTGHVMHHQFNIQQLYVLPTLYLCVLCLSENKQRLVSLTA